MAYPKVKVAQGQLTTAQVNAGYIIVPGRAGQQITVVDGWVRAIGGAASGLTSMEIGDGTTDALSFAQANLTQNTVLRAGATGATATNVGTALLKGIGLTLDKTGSAMATATAMDYCVYYTLT